MPENLKLLAFDTSTDRLSIAVTDGVREVLRNLLADVELTLGLAGCASFAEVGRDNVVSASAIP